MLARRDARVDAGKDGKVDEGNKGDDLLGMPSPPSRLARRAPRGGYPVRRGQEKGRMVTTWGSSVFRMVEERGEGFEEFKGFKGSKEFELLWT